MAKCSFAGRHFEHKGGGIWLEFRLFCCKTAEKEGLGGETPGGNGCSGVAKLFVVELGKERRLCARKVIGVW